jgi:integrase
MLPGFGLRVTDRGAKSWVVMFRLGGRKMPKRRLTLGSYPKLSLAEARERAREALSQVARGCDPIVENKQKQDVAMFESVAAEFIERHAKPKNRGWKHQENEIKHDLLPHWRHRNIASISRSDVLYVLDLVSDRASPVKANRTLALIRKLFNWCLERGILNVSPAATVRPPGKEVSRDRVLSDYEIRHVWAACDDLGYPFGPVFQLLLATGQRRDEIGFLRWQDIDEDAAVWTVPKEISKNKTANEVPLSRLAMQIIGDLPRYKDCELVFPAANRSGKPISGYSKAKRRLDAAIAEFRTQNEKLAMPPWWLHDLRRTAASSMARLGVAPHVIERVLNHKSGSQAGVAGIYNRYGYLKEKREALELWAQHLAKLVGAQTARRRSRRTADR